MALVAEGLRANTINRHRWQASAIYKRAARVWNVTVNPFANVDRQPVRPSHDFNILAPDEVLLLGAHLPETALRHGFVVQTTRPRCWRVHRMCTESWVRAVARNPTLPDRIRVSRSKALFDRARVLRTLPTGGTKVEVRTVPG